MAGTPAPTRPARAPDRAIARLLPAVKHATLTGEVAHVDRESLVKYHVADERLNRAWIRERPKLPHPKPTINSIPIRLLEDPNRINHPQGYRLTIKPTEITIAGHDSAGCFYGLQTLFQLMCDTAGRIPCGTIKDWPALQTRGLLHDITRGKVPTLDTLKSLVDRLAALKINQIQLYIEHAFTFAFDPEICTADDGITPDEVRALHEYAQEQFIDLVPAVASFGHMGRILSLPRYRHLAEIAPDVSWEQLDWPRRARGFTLNCLDPEAWRLVERIWSEILDAFPGEIVNICGDEPWDLGKGKNSKTLIGPKRGKAYLDHITKTYDFCRARGRRVQFWSDVIRTYPELLDRVPREATVLHWGYDDAADYDGTALFPQAQLSTFVCPGTSGWKRIVNSLNLAERNITRFAKTAIDIGAAGLINTDWGDHGHFQPLACSWHGIALGAQEAWNPGAIAADDFDACWSQRIWGSTDSTLANALRAATGTDHLCETWRLMWQPIEKARTDPHWPGVECAERIASAASDSRRALSEIPRSSVRDGIDYDELDIACRFLELFAERVLLRERSEMSDTSTGNSRGRIDEWAEKLNDATTTYAAVWNRRNKPSGLQDILAALSATRAELAGSLKR